MSPDMTEEAKTYSIVSRLAGGQSAASVAQSLGVSTALVERRAGFYGYPDRARLQEAAEVLRRGTLAARRRARGEGLVSEARRLVSEHASTQQRVTADGNPSRDPVTFLDKDHPLAPLARRCCAAAKHSRSLLVGSVACGACWEAAVRDDERRTLRLTSAAADACLTCDTPTGVAS